jgi:integrase
VEVRGVEPLSRPMRSPVGFKSLYLLICWVFSTSVILTNSGDVVLVLVLEMAFLVKHPQSKYWVAGFYDCNGKRRRRSTKIEAMESTRKRAMKIADEFELAAKQVRTARQVRKVITELHRELSGAELPTATVRQYSDSWIERKRNEVKPSTLTYYRSKTNTFIDFLGSRAEREIAEVTNADILKFRDSLATRVTAKTVNHTVKAIRMLFGDARIEGYVIEDPCEGVRSVRTIFAEITEVRPFTLEELRSVIEVASPEWKSMIFFGVYTMLRLSDLARLKFSAIDWDKGVLRVRASKTERIQMIPIAKALRDFLEGEGKFGQRGDLPVHPKLFETISKKGRSQTLSRQFATLLAKAGMREKVSSRSSKKGRDKKRKRNSLNFHSLRHTGNSLLANAGVGRELRKSLTGHTSESVHDGYTHLEVETRRAALDEMPDLGG